MIIHCNVCGWAEDDTFGERVGKGCKFGPQCNGTMQATEAVGLKQSVNEEICACGHSLALHVRYNGACMASLEPKCVCMFHLSPRPKQKEAVPVETEMPAPAVPKGSPVLDSIVAWGLSYCYGAAVLAIADAAARASRGETSTALHYAREAQRLLDKEIERYLAELEYDPDDNQI